MDRQKVAERRQFFRVDDRVRLRWRPVAPEEVSRLAGEIRAGVKRAGQLLADLEQGGRLASLRAAIADRDAPVADYLEILEGRIADLTRLVAVHENDLKEVGLHPVNLSGGGLSFTTASQLAMGLSIELQILLESRNLVVRALGEVVESAAENGIYHIGAKFTVIDPRDRDRVISHVLAKQAEIIREARRRAVAR